MPHEDTANTAAPAGRLAQPWRLAIAAGEVLLIIALVFAAWWCWGESRSSVEVPGADGAPMHSTRIAGNWVGLSVTAATAAAFAAIDVVRQSMLAWRVRRSRGPRR